MWRVDTDIVAVGAESWVGVDSPFASVDLWKMESSQIDSSTGCDVIKVRSLQTIGALRIGVVQNPLVTRQITQVSAAVENATANLFHDSVILILKQEVSPVRIAAVVFRLRKNVL